MTMKPPSDLCRRYLEDPEVRLMLRAREGDAEAFTVLTARYGPRVFGYFRDRMGNRTEAEDLTQEVFLRLYRSRLRYQPRARFSTWVFHVTQNVARNALRSRRRRPCVRLEWIDDDGQEMMPDQVLTDDGEPPAEAVEREELAGVVRAAVGCLNRRLRLAVELHQLQGRPCAEVAAELDLTPQAAKSLLHRARNRLRGLLAPFVQ
jgi:RNA polymerase sigma-70 factor (ECF subfamily)